MTKTFFRTLSSLFINSRLVVDVDDEDRVGNSQGCINCAILLSGIGARGVSSEHMENMDMFSCSPT